MLGDKWAAFNVRPGGLVDQFQKEQINNLLLLYFPTDLKTFDRVHDHPEDR